MHKRKYDGSGFAVVETLLVFVFIAIVGFVGWYVVRAKHATDKNLNTSNATSQASGKSGSSDNQGLENDLTGINSANNQTTKDMNSANSSLDDNSTFTSLP